MCYGTIKREIDEAIARSQIKLLAQTMPPLTEKKQRAGQRKRSSSTERNFEALCKDIVKNPEIYVRRMLELVKDIEELKESIQKLTIEKEQAISKHEKEMEEMRAEYEEKKEEMIAEFGEKLRMMTGNFDYWNC
jgi:hypothetical protein